MSLSAVDAHMRMHTAHTPPPSPPMTPPISAMEAVQDIFEAGARAAARVGEALHDMLFVTPSRRPLGNLCNNLFHVRIEHNSVVDIMLHIVFVAGCSAVIGAALGMAFGLSEPAQDMIVFVVTMAWHLGEPDGIFSI